MLLWYQNYSVWAKVISKRDRIRIGVFIKMTKIKTAQIIDIKTSIGKIFIVLFLIFVVLISISPFLWVFMSSFKSNLEILRSALSLPSSLSLDGYVAAVKMSPLPRYYINSIIISLSSTFLNVFLVGMAAYVMARFEFKFKNIISVILSISLFIPTITLIHPIYVMIKKFGLYDTKMGLIFVYTALGVPMTFYILRSYFLTIPKEIEESAYIDGAGFFQIYTKISIPMAKPGFATAAIIQFLLGWKEFLYALILTSSDKARTLPLSLNYFVAQFSFNYKAMFAALVIIIIPTIVLFILLQDWLVEGLSASYIKG